MAPCIRKEHFELFVRVRAGKAHPLHAEIDRHRESGIVGERQRGKVETRVTMPVLLEVLLEVLLRRGIEERNSLIILRG